MIIAQCELGHVINPGGLYKVAIELTRQRMKSGIITKQKYRQIKQNIVTGYELQFGVPLYEPKKPAPMRTRREVMKALRKAKRI